MGLFSRFKRGFKKLIILLLILGAIAVAVITFTTFGGSNLFGKNTTPVILDTDSGRDIDDLFAVSRALIAPELEVIGITSEQWNLQPGAGDSSVMVSQRINEQLLANFAHTGTAHPVGASRILWYSGNPQPRPSPAAEFIIKKAMNLKKGKKVSIIALGAMTNIASAVMMNPDIASKIRVYCVAMKYDPKSRIWNKNEFNTRSDLDAVDYLLNNSEVEMHIMTAITADALRFIRTDTEDLMKGKGTAWDFLLSRWTKKFPDQTNHIMRSVTLIEALIDPELVKEVPALTPPENKQRSVNVFTYLNKELMLADYESAVMKYIRNHQDEGKK